MAGERIWRISVLCCAASRRWCKRQALTVPRSDAGLPRGESLGEALAFCTALKSVCSASPGPVASAIYPPAPASRPDATQPPPPAASSSRRSATPAAAAPCPAVARTRSRRRVAALPRPASPPALAPKPIMHYHSNRTTRWGLISFSAIQSHGIDPPYSGGSLGLRCRWLEPSEGLAPHRFNLPEHIE